MISLLHCFNEGNFVGYTSNTAFTSLRGMTFNGHTFDVAHVFGLPKFLRKKADGSLGGIDINRLKILEKILDFKAKYYRIPVFRLLSKILGYF